MASTFPSRVLASPAGVAGLRGPGRGDGVLGVGLAAPATTLAVRTVDLDHRDALGVEVAGEPGAVAAGALDPDQLELTEARAASRAGSR